ncbi:MAG: hypothetical protein RL701_4766 [Pseudomonadota bacterium]
MAIDIQALKNTLQHELDGLRETGEQLRLQTALARADVRDEWARIETTIRRAQEEIQRVTQHVAPALHELEMTVRKLFDEVRGGYERLRQLQQH